MNFIAQRPNQWNQVIGQDRVIRLLTCILRTNRFMPRGYLFQGAVGVGKTTIAYLLSRALLCTGTDPMSCGKCPSCIFIAEAGDIEAGLNASVDFLEVDAASHRGVEHARGLMDIMNSPPSALSSRRVIIVDEAHQLTQEAWDVYLKPLEGKDTSSIFIFVSNHADSIPPSIRSRLTAVQYDLVHTDLIFGKLLSLASLNNIPYEHEALRILSVKAKGCVREGVKLLGMAASLGSLTSAGVKDLLIDTLEELSLKCFTEIMNNDQVAAVRWVDEAGNTFGTSKVVISLFSIYARSPWADPDTLQARLAVSLPNVSEVGAIFIKWMSSNNIPSDALPLLVYELMQFLNVPQKNQKNQHTSPTSALKGDMVPVKDVVKFLKAVKL